MPNLFRMSALILCIASLSCADANDNETSAVEAVDACAPLIPCGGNLEGDWDISMGCFSFMSVSGRPLIPSCPTATIEYMPDAAGGSYTFQNNGSYTAQFELVGRLILTVPTSCLPRGGSCAAFEDAEAGRSCVLTANQTCRCTELFEQSTDQRLTGSYMARGTRVDFSDDVSMNYCAQGDRLTLETVSVVEMGDDVDGQLRFVLERR